MSEPEPFSYHVMIRTGHGGYVIDYILPGKPKRRDIEEGTAVFASIKNAIRFAEQVLKAWEGPRDGKPEKVSDIVKKPKER